MCKHCAASAFVIAFMVTAASIVSITIITAPHARGQLHMTRC